MKPLVLTLLLGLLAMPVHARPKVALVLGGGGARGFAEIAAMEALEAYGLPVDMVLGTSMGALVGAMYSCGYSPKEIDAYASSHDFMSVVLEPPEERPFPMPEAFAARMDNVLSVGFSKNQIGSTPGILGDSRLLALLNEMYAPQAGTTDFDALPVPFRCVATDAVTGAGIVYDHGSLVDAVRSSISLPVVFAPYPQPDGSIAMDGGLVDNLPIVLARRLGADYVVAVDVNARQRLQADEVRSITDAAGQLSSLVTQASAMRQYDQADILIEPEVEGIGTMAFNDYGRIIAIGRKACADHADDFRALVASYLAAGGTLVAYDPDRTLVPPPVRTIASVRVDDRSTGPVRAELDDEAFGEYVGRPWDARTRRRFERYLERIKPSLQLASLGYAVADRDDRTLDVTVHAAAYPLPRHRFTIGAYPQAGVSNNGPEAYTWAVVTAQERLDFSHIGPISHLQFWFGQGNTSDIGLSVELPFVARNSHVFAFEAKALWRMGSLETASNLGYGDRRAPLDMGAVLDLGIFYDYGDLVTLRIGSRLEWDDIHHDEDQHLFPVGYASVAVDTMHEAGLIQSGFRGAVRYQAQRGENAAYRFSLEADFRQDVEIRNERQMLGYGLSWRWMRLEEGLNRSYVDIGGIDGFPGYSYASLRQDAAWALLRWRLRLTRVLGAPVCLVAKVQAGYAGTADPFEDGRVSGHPFHGDGEWDVGVAAGVAVTTPIGSFLLGGGIAALSGNWNLVIGAVV